MGVVDEDVNNDDGVVDDEEIGEDGEVGSKDVEGGKAGRANVRTS